MAERKVLVKYYPPDFNPERLIRNEKQTEKQDSVRMMLPFSLRCYTCGNYLYIGTKFNMRKETCDEDYLGIPIYRFYMKCNYCYSEITMKTDPKNSDYICEHGGARTYEAWKDARAAEHSLRDKREQEEKGNAMKFLENRTRDSKREMEILDALDEMRNMSRQNAKITPEQMLEFLDKRDASTFTPDEEEKINNIFKKKPASPVKMLEADAAPVDLSDNDQDGVTASSIKSKNELSTPASAFEAELDALKSKFSLKKKLTNLPMVAPPVPQAPKPKMAALCDYSDEE